MKHSEDINPAFGYTVDDAVVALQHFTQVLAADLRNDLAGVWELSQSPNGQS
ncbi:hypothetical protein LF1_46510 [Rubripirellula obstinata]|uniref:Uncharacterized protein n=1 Tax=Rubripirellula obstinata TaxID=406547 RepID=A0A5B1CR19_9BACT|nr:hypothetical protein LF1_46510 [Rubripirellula obstinata]